MLQNAYFLAKIGADTAENEQHFAEILPKIGNYPTGPKGRGRTTTATWIGRGERPAGRAQLLANFFGGAVWGVFRENANCGDPPG